MGFDHEYILGAEGDDIQDAYESRVYDAARWEREEEKREALRRRDAREQASRERAAGWEKGVTVRLARTGLSCDGTGYPETVSALFGGLLAEVVVHIPYRPATVRVPGVARDVLIDIDDSDLTRTDRGDRSAQTEPRPGTGAVVRVKGSPEDPEDPGSLGDPARDAAVGLFCGSAGRIVGGPDRAGVHRTDADRTWDVEVAGITRALPREAFTVLHGAPADLSTDLPADLPELEPAPEPGTAVEFCLDRDIYRRTADGTVPYPEQLVNFLSPGHGKVVGPVDGDGNLPVQFVLAGNVLPVARECLIGALPVLRKDPRAAHTNSRGGWPEGFLLEVTGPPSPLITAPVPVQPYLGRIGQAGSVIGGCWQQITFGTGGHEEQVPIPLLFLSRTFSSEPEVGA